MTRICNRRVTLAAGFLILSAAIGGSVFAGEKTSEGILARAQDIVLDMKGNVYTAGYCADPFAETDFFTVKYDTKGRLQWTARYDGPAGSSDYASAVAVDDNGSVYTAGHSNGKKTSLDLTVVKYDAGGREMWVYRYDGPSHRDDYAESMALDPEGNLYVTGYSFGAGTEHDFVTLKLSPNGREIWADRYNAPINRDDSARALCLHPDSGIVVTGTDRVRETSYDFLTFRYGADGRRIWQARYFSPGKEYDTARALALGKDGAVYVTGFSYRRAAEYDIVTIKYDPEGNRVWDASYNGPGGRMDTSCAISVSKEGNVYVAGKSLGKESAFDICLLKYDAQGREEWAKFYNGSGNGADAASALALDPDGNIVLTGYSRGEGTGRDIVLLKYAPDGSLIWETRYDGPVKGEDRPVSMVLDPGGNIYIGGYSIGEDGTFDCLTIKYGSDGQLQWVSRWPDMKKSD